MASQQDIAYQEAHASDDRSPSLYGTSAFCFFVVSFAIIGRFVSRWLSKSGLSWDDWLMAISGVFSFGVFSLNIVITTQGLGRHEIFVINRETFTIGATGVQLTYTLALLLIKLSTLVLWSRLFPGRSMHRILCGIGAVVFAYSLAQFVCVLVQCVPLSTLWDPAVHGKCIQLGTVFLVCSSFNIATDATIILIPITRLWKLQLSTNKKIQLTGLFLLGSFVLIISIIRLPYLQQISVVDEAWTLADAGIWSCLEVAIATLSACLPVMRPLLSLVFHQLDRTNISESKQTSLGWRKVSNENGLTQDNKNTKDIRVTNDIGITYQPRYHGPITDTLSDDLDSEGEIFTGSEASDLRKQTLRNAYGLG